MQLHHIRVYLHSRCEGLIKDDHLAIRGQCQIHVFNGKTLNRLHPGAPTNDRAHVTVERGPTGSTPPTRTYVVTNGKHNRSIREVGWSREFRPRVGPPLTRVHTHRVYDATVTSADLQFGVSHFATRIDAERFPEEELPVMLHGGAIVTARQAGRTVSITSRMRGSGCSMT